jgi:hypothetical protein
VASVKRFWKKQVGNWHMARQPKHDDGPRREPDSDDEKFEDDDSALDAAESGALSESVLDDDEFDEDDFDDDFDDDFEQELDEELDEDLGEFNERIEGEADEGDDVHDDD